MVERQASRGPAGTAGLGLADLARYVQGELRGADNPTIEALAPLTRARPGTLSFLPDASFADQLGYCGASAVLVPPSFADECAVPLIVADPLVAAARAWRWLLMSETRAGRIRDRRAPIVDETAEVHRSVELSSGVRIGAHSRLAANVTVAAGSIIGAYCSIGPHVDIGARVTLGNRVRIGSSSVIGSDPFMYVKDAVQWLRFPDFAGVLLRDEVECGAGVTIDRGLLENTELESGVKLDNQVHLGHGVRIGRNTIIAARTTVAGEVIIGEDCAIGGSSVINEGVSLAHGVVLAGMSAVTRSLNSAGRYASVWPVQPSKHWWQQVARMKKLSAD